MASMVTLGRSFLIFLKIVSLEVSEALRFQTWTTWQFALIDTVTPLISSPSSSSGENCSPITAKTSSLQTSDESEAFNLKLQKPPVSFFGSSQSGLTPSTIMCKLDLMLKLSGVGKLLKHSQNLWTVLNEHTTCRLDSYSVTVFPVPLKRSNQKHHEF
uniref:Uncharacterized protein n=1 Tax=Arcella intermedia TaxID=1963864 RepID=A0A6B2LLS9_9EUKA